MVHCCVPGCKNTHHHKNRGKDEWGNNQSQDYRNFSLHDLPNEDRMDVRELWVMAINRTTLPKDVAVCSDHFTEDCFDEKWEEYKRKYGPTKVKRKLKIDAVPTIFPGRIFIHEKVQRIKENWKNKVLQRQVELERLRLEREYKDRFKATQTECSCKCRCRLRKKHFSQQVNFQFKFMEDVGVQFPKDLTQTVKDDHSYTQGKGVKSGKSSSAATTGTKTSTSKAEISINTRSTKVSSSSDKDDESVETSKRKALNNDDDSDDNTNTKRPKLDESEESKSEVARNKESRKEVHEKEVGDDVIEKESGKGVCINAHEKGSVNDVHDKGVGPD